jgi:hypothetical protein
MFYGLGGVTGCTLAGYFVEMANPYPCFYIMSIFCASVGVAGLLIDKSLEDNQAEMVKMRFWDRSKFVFGEVYQGMKLKELYSAVIFQCILGAVLPNFNSYLYYY